MKVRAATGLQVPYENQPRRYIKQTPVNVPDTIYYRRLLAAGDLVTVKATRNKEAVTHD
ncbi:DUF2635 domain-containing protein [Salmonella enterica subsp. enterica serovar Enteritidis]|nr:DUF2635 domain-containing protein [Salmonella enterica]